MIISTVHKELFDKVKRKNEKLFFSFKSMIDSNFLTFPNFYLYLNEEKKNAEATHTTTHTLMLTVWKR